MEPIFTWLYNHWIENLAVVTGLIYILLSVKQRIWCWPFGIVSSVLYLYVFFDAKIYADMFLQLYYVLMGFYGWIHWARVDSASSNKKELPVSKLKLSQAILFLMLTLLLWLLIAKLLMRFTDSPVPWIDAFTTAFSFTATYMLARKILEHWIIWVIVDFISVALYFYRGLYPSIILFAIYTVLAVFGYLEWKKQWKKENTDILTS
ncbi:MAG: nicotinamide riboside transporter PnuC [Salinivirgaceae bacterium]